MTDQAPELLTRDELAHIKEAFTAFMPTSDLYTEISATILSKLTRPPSERPVAQVREALELADEFEAGSNAIDDVRRALIVKALRALTSERPSESAVALANDCELYAKVHGSNIIVVADDWKPGDPERTEPRDTLLKAAAFIRAALAIPHGDAVRALIEAARELDLAVEKTADHTEWFLAISMLHNALVALSPTLASERVSERETMTSVPADRVIGELPSEQVWSWLPIEHRPLKTGHYVVAHRGHEEILHFFGPDKHWAPGTIMGWRRLGKKGWERDDPVERFHATHCVLIQSTPDDSLVLKKDEQSGPVSSPRVSERTGEQTTFPIG